MEFFQFCLEIINREVKQFNTAFDTSGLKKLTIDSANNANYDLVKKRCHFMYRCGTINLYFAKVCFKTFLLDNKIVQVLLSKWNECTDLTLCSISTGPALDYIALLHSFQESKIIPPSFKNVKVISKHGAWRNTVNIMDQVVCEGYLRNLSSVKVGKMKVFHGDPFKDLVGKIKSSISSADVIMMIKRLNLNVKGYDQKKILNSMQVFLDSLKPGAVLFCIDTKESIKEITRALKLLPGTFLLKPTSMMTTIDFDYPNVIQKHVGCLPILSTLGSFLVWQKSPVSSQYLESTINDISISFEQKLNLDVDNKKISNSRTTDKCGSTSLNQIFVKQNDITATDIHQSTNSAKNCFEYSDCHLPSTSSQSVFNISIQTEPNEVLQETEAQKFMELAHRIKNITAELTKLLENSESRHCTNCFKNSEDISENFDEKEIHDRCSSAIPCAKSSESVQNCERCCGQYHSLAQCSFSHETASCFKVPSFNNPLVVNNRSIISSGNHLSSSAQLVIPLNNLSADVITQIISLISQSKEQINL